MQPCMVPYPLNLEVNIFLVGGGSGEQTFLYRCMGGRGILPNNCSLNSLFLDNALSNDQNDWLMLCLHISR